MPHTVRIQDRCAHAESVGHLPLFGAEYFAPNSTVSGRLDVALKHGRLWESCVSGHRLSAAVQPPCTGTERCKQLRNRTISRAVYHQAVYTYKLADEGLSGLSCIANRLSAFHADSPLDYKATAIRPWITKCHTSNPGPRPSEPRSESI